MEDKDKQNKEALQGPELESAFYQGLDDLAGVLFRQEHDLADGRIDDPNGALSRSFIELREIIKSRIEVACDRFNLIMPPPNTDFFGSLPEPPEGKTYFGDWCLKHEKEHIRSIVEGTYLAKGYH